MAPLPREVVEELLLPERHLVDPCTAMPTLLLADIVQGGQGVAEAQGDAASLVGVATEERRQAGRVVLEEGPAERLRMSVIVSTPNVLGSKRRSCTIIMPNELLGWSEARSVTMNKALL